MRITPVLFAGAFAFASAAGTSSVQIRDVDGRQLNPFRPTGKLNVLFFVSSDCPISNSYAPEIQRLCRAYGPKGVGCSLFYEDVGITAEAVRKHLAEYRYSGIPARHRRSARHYERGEGKRYAGDRGRRRKGRLRYRGRIDNFYADLGKPRQQVTVHDLSDALDAVLAGRRVANPESQTLGCYIVDPDILRK